MTTIRSMLLVGLAMAGAIRFLPAAEAADALTRVRVVYLDPRAFTDVRDGYAATDRARDAYLGELKRYIERRTVPRIAEGQQLTITITNINMAGNFEPWRDPQAGNVRIVREVYPARIDLEFRLTDAGGAVLSEGRRTLRSFGYPVSPTVYSSDPLLYEKVLLGDWLEREFSRQDSQ